MSGRVASPLTSRAGCPVFFALPAGIGAVATGLLAPFVTYVWDSGKQYARGAAVAWNVFGMADLINAVALGTLTVPQLGVGFLMPRISA
jgi:hypothetical protein